MTTRSGENMDVYSSIGTGISSANTGSIALIETWRGYVDEIARAGTALANVDGRISIISST
jgi:hypothetical protein